MCIILEQQSRSLKQIRGAKHDDSSRVGVLELDQGSNCPSHCQGWGGGGIEFGLGRILTKHDERRTRTLP